MDDARARLGEAVHRVDAGEGVLVLTDMFGGTPANLALTFLDEKLEVITGVNLPMILKLATARADGLQLRPAAELVTSHGQKNITLASDLLRSRARTSRT
jgi:PTS system mannose-specific IIA component